MNFTCLRMQSISVLSSKRSYLFKTWVKAKEIGFFTRKDWSILTCSRIVLLSILGSWHFPDTVTTSLENSSVLPQGSQCRGDSDFFITFDLLACFSHHKIRQYSLSVATNVQKSLMPVSYTALSWDFSSQNPGRDVCW